VLLALILANIHIADAQQPKKIPRIGYLTGVGSAPNEAFLQGLRDLGYVEGKNILIEFRTTEGKSERRPELAAELVQLRVDVIVADTAGEVTAAKNATVTIPIVMRGVADPIALGLVASLAHPGGNITGVAALAPELSGKRLELLKEVIPKLSRVACFTPGACTQVSRNGTHGAGFGLAISGSPSERWMNWKACLTRRKSSVPGSRTGQATSLVPYSRIIDSP
jgi:putative ABC transport system substrate-binding protein